MVNQYQALTMAIELVKKRIQAIASEADLHDRYGNESIAAKRSSQERGKLREALAVLDDLRNSSIG